MTLLSIVVPIRDMKGALLPLFQWVENALSLNCEVVLVHDFLESQTEDELSAFVKGHDSKNLRFISSTFNSPGLARNAGLIHTVGEYVAFWDADDVPHVKQILDLTKRCLDSGFEIGIGGFQTINQEQNTLKTYPATFQNSLFKVAMYPGLWRMVFKSSILKNMQFTNLLLAEDQLFLAGILPADRKVLFGDQIVYKYTVQRKESLTSQRTNTSDLIQAVDVLINQTRCGITDESLKFNLALIIKNALTILKIGSNKHRLRAFRSTGQIIFTYPLSVFKIIFTIVKFKKEERSK